MASYVLFPAQLLEGARTSDRQGGATRMKRISKWWLGSVARWWRGHQRTEVGLAKLIIKCGQSKTNYHHAASCDPRRSSKPLTERPKTPMSCGPTASLMQPHHYHIVIRRQLYRLSMAQSLYHRDAVLILSLAIKLTPTIPYQIASIECAYRQQARTDHTADRGISMAVLS